MNFLMVVGFVFLCLWVVSRRLVRKGSVNPLGVDGELIYADKGRASKLFVNPEYGISAKPDFIFRTKDGKNLMVEYKSRSGGVYKSDIVQLKASVLAARHSMPIDRAMVVTKGTRQIVPIGSSAEIFKEIATFVDMARRARRGEIIRVFSDNPNMCRRCSVAKNCQR